MAAASGHPPIFDLASAGDAMERATSGKQFFSYQ
jgi:hypothetical protein